MLSIFNKLKSLIYFNKFNSEKERIKQETPNKIINKPEETPNKIINKPEEKTGIMSLIEYDPNYHKYRRSFEIIGNYNPRLFNT